MAEETRTETGNTIAHLKEVEYRREADGTEKRLHLGYSSEGFHAAVGTTAGGPYEWGKAYPEAGPALKAVWDTGPDSEKVEGKSMAEIPDDVKARADVAVSRAGAEKMPVRDMGGTPAAQTADAYDTKALEAQRERQRQDAKDNKTAEPQPDKG